ncbi:MAG: diacylglycerol kinase family protein [Lachnospiraceae bacterium]|nr:diacylglycerol kinase family protein [Lachnospiraceae bacterium]
MIHIFIINTLVAPPRYGDAIKEMLSDSNIKYYVFNTSKKGMEGDIAERMIRFFEGEKLRFYCIGGSGTFRNVVNKAIDYQDAEFAFCPYGATNDFLKVFGEDEAYFKDLNNLINGNVVDIDYIKTNHGVAVNTVSFGTDAEYSKYVMTSEEFEVLGKKLAFALPFFRAIFSSKKQRVTITYNGISVSDYISEAIIGNGYVLGGGIKFSDKFDYRDGKLSYTFIFNKSRLQLTRLLFKLVGGKLNEVLDEVITGEITECDLRTEDGKDIFVNFDGELVDADNYWHMEIVERGLKFIVPKMIEIN